MIFFFFFRENGLHEFLYRSQKNGHDPLGCVRMTFLSGVRCAPAFFERCGRFTKNCVCSRLHSPQRLTRLCGCCDEPHFCFRKNGFHESLYHSQKKTDTPRSGVSVFGCDTGIRTPTGRVRGCSATFTLYRNTALVYQAFILYYI